jgi:hypothetical protein
MSNNLPLDHRLLQEGPPLSTPLTSADILGIYDNPAIGQEFKPPSASLKRSKEHEIRRAQLQMENWKEISSLSESERIPKSSLTKACQYETRRVYSDSIVTWSVFFVLASLAGIIGGLAITHLAL